MSESASEIYVVDDDLSVRESVGRLIRSAGLNVKTFPTAQEILANLERELPSCLVLDIQLPDLDGFELQDQLARRDIQIPIIFLTGHGDIPMSVRAIKAGAVNFLTKPFNDEYFLEAIRDAIGRRNENGKNVRASNEIIGQSGAYRRIIRQVETVAPTDATVLILGETGTAAVGKINPWSGSIAPPSRRNCLKANFSVTPGAHSRGLSKTAPAVSRPLKVELYS
jgi:FixJ family two-component response regulator